MAIFPASGGGADPADNVNITGKWTVITPTDADTSQIADVAYVLSKSGGGGSITLTGDVTGTQSGSGIVTTVAQVDSVSAADVSAGVQLAANATRDNTPNTLVRRDGNGIFKTAAIELGADGVGDQAVRYTQVSTMVNEAIASGVLYKNPVATTALTNVVTTTAKAGDTINGRVLALNDRILLTAQTTALENGVWVAGASSLSRSTDFAVGVDASAFAVATMYGNQQGYTYKVTTHPAIIGTNALSFVVIAVGSTVTVDGTTLSQTGNVISVKDGGVGSTQLSAGVQARLVPTSGTSSQYIAGNNTLRTLINGTAAGNNILISNPSDASQVQYSGNIITSTAPNSSSTNVTIPTSLAVYNAISAGGGSQYTKSSMLYLTTTLSSPASGNWYIGTAAQWAAIGGSYVNTATTITSGGTDSNQWTITNNSGGDITYFVTIHMLPKFFSTSSVAGISAQLILNDITLIYPRSFYPSQFQNGYTTSAGYAGSTPIVKAKFVIANGATAYLGLFASLYPPGGASQISSGINSTYIIFEEVHGIAG